VSLIDLTHKFHSGIPHSVHVPGVELEPIMSLPEDVANVMRCSFSTHCGTHLDAPRHFYHELPGIDEIPLDALCGTSSLVRVEPEAGRVSAAQLEVAGKHVKPGDRMFLDSGFTEMFHKGETEPHPYLDEEATEWVIERGVGVIVLDFMSPDIPMEMRGPGFDHPVHLALLGNGVLIVENANLATELPERFDALIMPLPLLEGDGAPVRIAASL
jgi:arylformamidase